MKRVLLLGGGHAQLQVLHALARQPVAGAAFTLVTPFAHQTYSGMVPGLVAGHYSLAQCQIPIEPLARAAGVQLLQGSVVALDAAARSVRLADGRELGYELLSLDTGSTMSRERIEGAREHALFVRPIEHFVQLLDPLLALSRERVLDVVVVGGGAGGVELAMALQHRLAGQGDERARVALVCGDGPPLFGYPQTVIDRGLRALARRRITVLRERCLRIEAGVMHLGNGARLACDAPVLATGGEAPPYLQGSGLQLDESGFVAVGPTQQSLSHPEVLAAGDVSVRPDAPRPRSGVYAVRAGPVLAANLRALVQGAEPQRWQPQQRSLNLLACGERSAIASWGPLAVQGRWAWWWKDRIDRGFMARMSAVPPSKAPDV